MITFKQTGSFNKTEKWLSEMEKLSFASVLDKYGRIGVEALASATPKDTGKTADSWGYQISEKNGISKITFTNSNVQNGLCIAILIQYGHGTGTGGWVEGTDYINPTIRPIFDKIANDAWKEVTSK